MRLQILSDLHLETEVFDPRPAPGAELLVLAGDIDRDWGGYARFAGWPVPVLVVAGNHEFDRREWRQAWPDFRAHIAGLGFTLLDHGQCLRRGDDGRRIRFLGCTRWTDFDAFGPGPREKALRAARYFVEVMRATRDGLPLDAQAVREEALASRAWLAAALAAPAPADPADPAGWDATVVITHHAPSLRSADPRYGEQLGTASFCNADEALMPGVDLWIHGHLHCRADYRVPHPDGRVTRVLSNARGLAKKDEPNGHDPLRCVVV